MTVGETTILSLVSTLRAKQMTTNLWGQIITFSRGPRLQRALWNDLFNRLSFETSRECLKFLGVSMLMVYEWCVWCCRWRHSTEWAAVQVPDCGRDEESGWWLSADWRQTRREDGLQPRVYVRSVQPIRNINPPVLLKILL